MIFNKRIKVRDEIMEQAYYTLHQASQLLQLSEVTIRRKIKAGLIPKAVFSGKILIPASFFEDGLITHKDIKID